VFFTDLATFANPPGPENATELLARLPLQAIIYAWTVGNYLLGTTGEHELVTRVERMTLWFMALSYRHSPLWRVRGQHYGQVGQIRCEAHRTRLLSVDMRCRCRGERPDREHR